MRQKKFGHQKIESSLKMRNLQGRLFISLPTQVGLPSPHFKTGHPDDGTLKILAGIPFRPPARPDRRMEG